MLFGAWFRRHGVRAYSRRIKTEEKTKVVAAVLGTEFIQFIAALAILHQEGLKKGMNSSYHSGAIHPILHIVLVQFIPILQIVLVQNS